MTIGDRLESIAENVATTRETVARIEERQIVLKKEVDKVTGAVFGTRGLIDRVGGLERSENARQLRAKRTRRVVMAAVIAGAGTLGTIVVTDVWNRYTSPAQAATPTTGPAR